MAAAAHLCSVAGLPYGPGLSLLDAIPILPQHKLQKAYAAGKFREAWG